MHRCHDTKKSGITQVDILWTIVLFQVDCNYTFKFIGWEMMCNADKYGLIAKEQYESRKKHCGTDHTLNKVLSSDLLRQLKQSGAICSNDAKSCYDLITHTPASLSMQGFGVTKSFIVCMLETLQNTNHQVWTAYGDSDLSYQGSAQIIPMNRIGQGNGVRPAIWVVVSMPLLSLLRSEGVGCTITAPISKKEIAFVGYAFVYDTDLILSSRNHTPTEGVKVNSDAPGNISVHEISGSIKTLKRLKPGEAATLMEVDIAPDGNWEQQVKKMAAQSELLVDRIHSGKLRREEVCIALNSTLWETLQYLVMPQL